VADLLLVEHFGGRDARSACPHDDHVPHLGDLRPQGHEEHGQHQQLH
jgi:hypothetical protein